MADAPAHRLRLACCKRELVILPQTGFGEALHKAAALGGHVAATPLVGEHAVSIGCGLTGSAPNDDVDALLQCADLGPVYR